MAGKLETRRRADARASQKAGARLAVGDRGAGDAPRAAARAALDDAGAVYLPERLHAVRIALKKLRYALEARAEASGPTIEAGAPGR